MISTQAKTLGCHFTLYAVMKVYLKVLRDSKMEVFPWVKVTRQLLMAAETIPQFCTRVDE